MNLIKAQRSIAARLSGATVTRQARHGGVQVLVKFPNGYGASIINHQFSYGVELAVLHENNDKLCYATPVTDDVIGHLDEERLLTVLRQIAALPANEACGHQRNWDE
jgi:hypothetical protein